jgi:hypothetical protein
MRNKANLQGAKINTNCCFEKGLRENARIVPTRKQSQFLEGDKAKMASPYQGDPVVRNKAKSREDGAYRQD